MDFEQMAQQSADGDEEGVGGEGEAPERAVRDLEQQRLASGSRESINGYISYTEMQELQRVLAELLHGIVDLYLTFLVSIKKVSPN